MTTLTWHTLLLLAVTYFSGCCVGCLARRSAWRRRAQPALREAAQSHAPAADAVSVPSGSDRATTPVPVVANRSATAAVPQQPLHEPFRRADTAAPQPGPAMDMPGALPDTSRAARFERALEAGGDAAMQPQAAAAETSAARDDLKRIRAIDAAVETRLQALGAGTFADMARWTAADVARLSRALGFKGRIEQENWIEQAQILARGGDTRYSLRLARGETAIARPVADEGEPPPPAVRLAPAPAPAVRSLSPAVASTPDDGPVSSPNVSDRAAFSRVGETAFSRDDDRPTSSEQAPPEPRGSEEQATEASGGRAGTLAALRSVRSQAYHPPRDSATARGRPEQPNDLKRIRGVGLLIEKELNRLGVTSYEHIANWTAADIDRVSRVLDFKGRIERENWVEQARILASGGQTEFSRRIDRRGLGSIGAP